MGGKRSKAIILFARDPVAGRVKTRLARDLSEEFVLELYRRFLRDSLALLGKVPEADCFCGVHPVPESGFFEEAGTEYGVEVFAQEGGDLGERMRKAFQRKFNAGYENAAIIGSDSPSLPSAYIERALASDADVAIGPGTDGGYYLIGMRRRVTEIFSQIDWGTDSVLASTAGLLKRLGASVEVLPPWYDVDELADLKFLKTHLSLLNLCGQNAAPATWDLIKDKQF